MTALFFQLALVGRIGQSHRPCNEIHPSHRHPFDRGWVPIWHEPFERLENAIGSINAEHKDAEFAVLTGDMTHWGSADAYKRFAKAIAILDMPVHLMVGNHDDTPSLLKTFPGLLRDENGFVQKVLETPSGRFLLLDTTAPKGHAGSYCELRCNWLKHQLETPDPIFLFMHHPPFDVGIKSMDAIKMQDVDSFYEVIAPHKDRIRHLFFGHVHRAIWGNWKGISYSCMRGLNHQVALDLKAPPDRIKGNFEPPAYGVVLLKGDQVTVHLHDFTNASNRFEL